jgi:hypothetical protein
MMDPTKIRWDAATLARVESLAGERHVAPEILLRGTVNEGLSVN